MSKANQKVVETAAQQSVEELRAENDELKKLLKQREKQLQIVSGTLNQVMERIGSFSADANRLYGMGSATLNFESPQPEHRNGN